MLTRRVLTIVPLIVIAVLLQSAFWVPTYDNQDAAGDERLRTFIEGKIGDAKILNPVVASDGASSEITSMVFEGLLDLDEDMNWIGSLAERWETDSVATLHLLPDRTLADGSPATATRVAEIVETELANGRLASLAGHVRGVSAQPSETRSAHVTLEPESPEDASGDSDDPSEEPREVELRIRVPEHVVFELDEVLPDLFEQLRPLLGDAVLEPSGIKSHFTTADSENAPDLARIDESTLGEHFSVMEQTPRMRFYLRKNVPFHDGHLFDSGDVVFTYHAYLDPKNASPRASTWEPVQSVTAVDEHSVEVVYKRLYSPATIAWATAILPEHLMNDAALTKEMDERGIEGEARKSFGLRQSSTSRNPIGTGSFRFVEWKGDEFIHLAGFDDHWERPPEYDDYYFRIVPEIVTQEIEFRSGGIDAYSPLPYQVARYREDDRYQAISAVAGFYAYIGYNLRRPLFQDVRLRKALGMAINIDDIIQYVLYGEGDRVSGPYFINTPFYNKETPMLPYDPEGAAALLREAGWEKGPDGILAKDGKRLEFTLTTNNGNPNRKAIVTIAQNAWKKLGIDVRTQLLEWTVFIEQANQNEYDAFVLAWGGGGINPDLYQLWHSSQTGTEQLNHAGYENPEADALIEKIRETYDTEEQRRLARQLHSMIAADHPSTFLYSKRSNLVLDRKIVQVEDADGEPGGEEQYRQIKPTSSGSIRFFFDRWRKLANAVPFEEAG